MEIQHIVVATDFSPASAATYPHAAALAHLTRARVTLLAVHEVPEEDQRHGWLDEHFEMARVESTRLLGQAQRALRALEVQAAVARRSGDPTEEICALAHEQGADLVLMGQRGHRGVRRLLLGRTTRRTLRRIDVPVLVVPPGTRQPAAEAPTLQDLPHYRRILATTDFGRASRLGLRAAADLAALLDSQLDVMHVLNVPALAPFPTDMDAWPLMIPPSARQELERRLADEVARTLDERARERCHPQVVAGFSVADTVSNTARAWDMDLIAIPSRSRRRVSHVLFGSTTDNMLRLAPVPVLVFPVDYLVRRYQREGED